MRHITRRQFLRTSAAATAAGPSLLAAAGRAPQSSPRNVLGANDRVRLGVIGCGGMGRGNLATFFGNADVDCAAICDIDAAQMAQTLQLVEKHRDRKPDTATDFRRIIDRSDIDVLLISTPDHWHALPTVLGCQAGKDIYVEKPLANSIAEGRAMLDATRRHGRIVQMGTQWRSGVHWKEAMDVVHSGKLGKIGLVRGWAYHDWLGDVGHPPDGHPPEGVDYDMWLGPAPKRPFNPNRFHFNFRWFWDYAGGLMTDWGVHLINIMLWGMGLEAPTRVSSSGGKFVLDDNSETPDTQIAVYEFPSYSLVWEHKVGIGVGLNGRPWGISFSGSEGTLIINDARWEIVPEPKKKALEPAEFKGSGDARPAHVRNFLDCVRTREAPVENLEVGHLVSTVAHLGNIALRTGRTIQWDARNEQVVGDRDANRLVTPRYRKPWTLPYMRS
jgi:predicted dehydrogenase